MRGRVLVVEDEPVVLRSFDRLLGQAGFKVEACASARRAVERVAEGGLDAVVSDIHMPELDGIQLLRAVREYDLDLPVVLITGVPTLASAVQALEYGAFQYLEKPIESGQLERSVSRAVHAGRIARTKRLALEMIGADGMLLGDRAGLEVSFERALASLWTAYQPIVRALDRSTVGYEALLRTEEPLLSTPAVLLLAAERLEQVQTVGRRVREQVVAPPESLMLFVKVHARELRSDAIAAEGTQLAAIADRVVLEISDRVALDAIPGLMDTVARLRGAGFRIALDDLGSGYAGLSSFAMLEPEFVKLDTALIRALDTNATKYKVVGATAMLCKDLGITAIADGIETEAERDAVVELGVDLLQGERFARPGQAFPLAAW